tara:strand:+ start:2974 stop:3147 length:174 start_codon:yes stop_codon:yes gene_type:complete
MKIGVLVNKGSMWIGCHYSDYTKRYCINLIPCVTVWVTKKGGQVPHNAKMYWDCDKL